MFCSNILEKWVLRVSVYGKLIFGFDGIRNDQLLQKYAMDSVVSACVIRKVSSGVQWSG